MLNFILAVLAITGAVVDRKYKKAGGHKPTTTEKRCLYLAIGLCVLLIVALGVLGAGAGAVGSLAGFLTWPVFALFELQRFRVRRKFPVVGGAVRIRI